MSGGAVMKAHPAAELFPLMNEERLTQLVDNIRDRGLIVPIDLCDGMILDGRNRVKACELAGVEPRFEQWAGDNPFEYVWSLNGERRDLSSSQRYLSWLRVDESSADSWLR